MWPVGILVFCVFFFFLFQKETHINENLTAQVRLPPKSYVLHESNHRLLCNSVMRDIYFNEYFLGKSNLFEGILFVFIRTSV